jgi:hypothetical protein
VVLDPNQYFIDNYYKVELESLIQLNKKNPSEGITRFINGLNDYVYGVFISSDNELNKDTIHLLYAQFKREFECFVIPITFDDPIADEIAFVFAREINLLNPEKEIFEVFNTLQHYRETALEVLGHFTFNPETTPNGTLLSVNQLIIPVLKMDRLDFYRKQFANIENDSEKYSSIDNFIYLMVDNTNGLIKIGRSKTPFYREGTLQSKEPQTHLFSYWRAPKEVENELHRKFKKKRVRGEWFRLTISDLDEIKFYMHKLYHG